MDELRESCKLILKLLDQLRKENKITEEEYEKHAALKMKFLDEAPE